MYLPGLAVASVISSCMRLRGKRGMHDHHLRRGGCDGHRREALDRVVGHFAGDGRSDGEIVGNEQERVAVAGRIGGGDGTDHAARAGEIFDEEVLPEALGELLRDEARHHVGRSAGGVGHDDADLARRIAAGRVLGVARARQHQRRQAGSDMDDGFHGVFLSPVDRCFRRKVNAGAPGGKRVRCVLAAWAVLPGPVLRENCKSAMSARARTGCRRWGIFAFYLSTVTRRPHLLRA